MTPTFRLLVSSLACAAGLVLAASRGQAAAMRGPEENFDEAKVPAYSLPDPLVSEDGVRIVTVDDWRLRRRPELLELFSREVYGHTPGGRPAAMHWELVSRDPKALNGAATREEYVVWFTQGREGPSMNLLVYLPNAAKGRVPVFVGLNFFGNHTVEADPGIHLPVAWLPNYSVVKITNNRATEESRGVEASKWQVRKVIERGYATATVYRGDLCQDRPDGFLEGPNRLFRKRPAGDLGRDSNEWGAIGLWAWGLSRMLDVLEENPAVDAKRAVVHGFSRLGKAAVWAAAQDERFAAVVSNESGCGGAALSKRIYGETVAIINYHFPFWFAPNFRRYDDHEADLPVDQHELLALIAPRPLHVGSAVEDRHSDPLGEFLGLKGAESVYALYGYAGLGVTAMPALSTVVGDRIRYHVRPGRHDMTAEDWGYYLDFADRWVGPKSGP